MKPETLAKLIWISTIVIIISIYVTGLLLIYQIDEVRSETVKLKEKYEKPVVAFGDGWEIRLDDSKDYKTTCVGLMQAFEVIYGSIKQKDSIP